MNGLPAACMDSEQKRVENAAVDSQGFEKAVDLLGTLPVGHGSSIRRSSERCDPVDPFPRTQHPHDDDDDDDASYCGFCLS